MNVTRSLLLFSLSIGCAGCLELTQEVWVNQDGSGRMRLDIALPQGLMEMATGQVQHRVARTLLRLAAQSGAFEHTGNGASVEIAFPITRRHISEMGGTTLHTVSRLLSAWEKQGIVESRRKHLSIRNAAELKALCAAS